MIWHLQTGIYFYFKTGDGR